jgi:monothiol glutaredoxin
MTDGIQINNFAGNDDEQVISASYDDALKNVGDDVAANDVIVYMKGNKTFPRCGFSARVVQILNTTGVDYATRDVLIDDNLRQAIKDYSDWPTLPQLYIRGEFVGGSDIVTELYQNGELQTMLTQ